MKSIKQKAPPTTPGPSLSAFCNQKQSWKKEAGKGRELANLILALPRWAKCESSLIQVIL